MTAEGVQVTEYNPFIEGTRDQAEVRKLLELRGTASQLERYDAGLLPDDELFALARTVLFAPFAGFRRWVKLAPADLMHRRGCHGDVAFETRSAPDLNAEEWAMFKTIRDVVFEANDNVLREHHTSGDVSIVEHAGTCAVCGAQVFARSASVRIEWAGRPLSREYSLEVT
jgi:hypothetical protein